MNVFHHIKLEKRNKVHLTLNLLETFKLEHKGTNIRCAMIILIFVRKHVITYVLFRRKVAIRIFRYTIESSEYNCIKYKRSRRDCENKVLIRDFVITSLTH